MATFATVDAMLKELKTEMRGTMRQAVSAMGRAVPRSLAPRTGIAPAQRPVTPEPVKIPAVGEAPRVRYKSERAYESGIKPYRGFVLVRWAAVEAVRAGGGRKKNGTTRAAILQAAQPKLKKLRKVPRRGLARKLWRFLSSSGTRNFAVYSRVVGKKTERHSMAQSRVQLDSLLNYADRATPERVIDAAVRAAYNSEMAKAKIRLERAERVGG